MPPVKPMPGQTQVANSSLTAIKLAGLLCMVADHYNSFVKAGFNPALYETGRLALPFFVFVLGYNLSRIRPQQMPKVMLRLLVFGLISTPVYNILSGGLWYWWPLNILFTLLVATAIVYLLAIPATRARALQLRFAAILFFAVAGSLVDYLWIGPALTVAVWYRFSAASRREKRLGNLALGCLAGLLCLLNQSPAALLALPVIFLLTMHCSNLALPRMKWFFYWFYPAHLLALLALKLAAQG